MADQTAVATGVRTHACTRTRALLLNTSPIDHLCVGPLCCGLRFVGVSLTFTGVLWLTSGGWIKIKLFREVNFTVVFWLDHCSASGFIIKCSCIFTTVFISRSSSISERPALEWKLRKLWNFFFTSGKTVLFFTSGITVLLPIPNQVWEVLNLLSDKNQDSLTYTHTYTPYTQ